MTDEEEIKFKSEVSQATQGIVSLLLGMGLGPNESAYTLGVTMSALIEFLDQKNPDSNSDVHKDMMMKIFNKALATVKSKILIIES